MKKELSILSVILTILISLTSCNNSEIFAIQNCYGEMIDVDITFELNSNSYSILPEIKDSLKGNTLNIKLEYPNKINIIETKFSELEKGLPIKYIKITRSGKHKEFKKGQNIEYDMDLDIIGEISCCPYILCI